jgi:hypothetical protein
MLLSAPRACRCRGGQAVKSLATGLRTTWPSQPGGRPCKHPATPEPAIMRQEKWQAHRTNKHSESALCRRRNNAEYELPLAASTSWHDGSY